MTTTFRWFFHGWRNWKYACSIVSYYYVYKVKYYSSNLPTKCACKLQQQNESLKIWQGCYLYLFVPNCFTRQNPNQCTANHVAVNRNWSRYSNKTVTTLIEQSNVLYIWELSKFCLTNSKMRPPPLMFCQSYVSTNQILRNLFNFNSPIVSPPILGDQSICHSFLPPYNCVCICRFGELLCRWFYPLHLCLHQPNKFWLAKSRLALWLKHDNGLFLVVNLLLNPIII